VCHFGLGDVNHVDVRVSLPNGRVIDRRNVKVDQALVVSE